MNKIGQLKPGQFWGFLDGSGRYIMEIEDRWHHNQRTVKYYDYRDAKLAPGEAHYCGENHFRIWIGGTKRGGVPAQRIIADGQGGLRAVTAEEKETEHRAKLILGLAGLCSKRTANACLKAGVKTVGDLVRYRASEILEWRGMGQKGVQELRDIVELELGLRLRAEYKPRKRIYDPFEVRHG
jgi:hypothetical protein